ncbi:MAG: tetratricopeptide repeat protein [Vulcanimicrobiota bacterium]
MKKKAIEVCNEGYSLGLRESYGEALECFEKALQFDPSLAVAWSNKGLVLAKMGNFPDALVCLEKAVKLKPISYSMWVNWAEVLIMAEKFDQALEKSEKATRLCFRDIKPWITKGNALFKMGRSKEALECYERALSMDKASTQALKNKRAALMALGQYKEAVACHERLIELEPSFVENWIGLGLLLEEMGREDEALLNYEKAVKHVPGTTLTWLSIGRLKEKKGLTEEALTAYRQALSMDPALIEVRRHMTVLSGRGRTEHLLSALKDDPDNKEIYLELAFDYYAERQNKKAMELLSQIPPMYCNDPDLLYLKAWILYEQGMLKEAHEILADLVTHYDQHTGAHLTLGLLYSREGKINAAERELRTVVSLNPHNTNAKYHLCNLLVQIGKYGEAEKELQGLLVIDPQNLTARITVGSIYMKQGLGKKAESVYRELGKNNGSVPGVREGLISALILQNKSDEAEKMLREMEQQRIENSFIRFSLGYIYHFRSDKEKALIQWEFLEKLPLITAQDYILLVLASFMKGDVEKTLSLCEEGIRRFPDTFFLRNFLGIEKVQSGAYNEAREIFKSLVAKHPWHMDGHFSLARLLWRTGRKSDAVESFKNAVAPPGDATPLTLTAEGFIHLSMCRYSEAQSFGKQALERDPGFVDAHFLLGLISIETGAFREAGEHFGEAHRLVPHCSEYMEACRRLSS